MSYTKQGRSTVFCAAALPLYCSFPGTLCRQSSAAAGTICPARPVWYQVQPVQRVQCPGGGLPWYLPALVYPAWPALLFVLCRPSRCAGGLGSPPAGYTGSAVGGVGHARDKIFQRKRRFSASLSLTPTPPSQNETHPIVQVSKNSKKYKKTPFEVLDVL